jgi:hypothetical protein
VRLIRASSPTVPMPVIYEPTVCLVAQGVKQAWLGTTSAVFCPVQLLLRQLAGYSPRAFSW